MKKLSSKKIGVICLVFAILVLAINIYLIARPISYDWGYYAEDEYQGIQFEGVMKFNSDGTMVLRNSNHGREMESYYYYKDGHVFFTMAETDEAYEEEVAYINENFEEALNTPFYADKINAFRLTADGPDGYTVVYACTQAILYVIIGGVIELALVGLACAKLSACKKAKQEK